jgi:hypothetical protein
VILFGLGCKSPPGEEPGDASVDAGVSVRPHLHSHNDYEHPRPLLDALDQGFDSVEADVDLFNGDLGVSHDNVSPKGTLKSLYLDPLKARVAANGGSVYGDGKTFYLWIDLKSGSAQLQDLLTQQLAACDFLTTFNDTGIEQQRAVTVILTGNPAKDALVSRPSPRQYVRDDGTYAASDPPADGRWQHYAINYGLTITWDGVREINASELRTLKVIVNGAHGKGRRVRFYGSPLERDYYRVAADLGVDFIGTDDLVGLSSYMKELYP